MANYETVNCLDVNGMQSDCVVLGEIREGETVVISFNDDTSACKVDVEKSGIRIWPDSSSSVSAEGVGITGIRGSRHIDKNGSEFWSTMVRTGGNAQVKNLTPGKSETINFRRTS